jgi:uncharacterized protein
MTMTTPVRGRADTLERIARSRAMLCAYGVTSIAVFGSASRDEMAPDSDVDVLVDFDHPIGAFAFLDLKADLERLLGRPVDLVTPAAIKPRMRARIRREAIRAT